MVRIFAISLLLSILPQVSAHSQPGQAVDLLAEILHTGSPIDLAVEGDRLYAANHYGVEVLDITDPLVPRFLGRYPTLGYAWSIAVRDSVAFVADLDGSWSALDCSDPANIRSIYRRDDPGRTFDQIRIFGDRIYICVWQEGITILDAVNPRELTWLGAWRHPSYPSSLWMKDSIGYATNVTTDEVLIGNLTNPRQPVVLGSIDVPGGYLDDISGLDTLLFVAVGEAGVRIFNIADPVNPELVAEIGTPDWAESVAAIGDALYVGDTGAGLLVYDISDPAEPNLVYSDDSTYIYVTQVLFEGNHAFVAGSFTGWSYWDVTEPLAPERLALHLPKPSVYQFAANNGALFVPRNNNGLMIFDISNPADPQLAKEIDSLYVGRVIATEDGWLYTRGLADNDTTPILQAWDVSNPFEPVPRGSSDLDLWFSYFSIGEDVIALNEWGSKVELWDITTRGSPTFLADIADIEARDVYIDGERLYVTRNDNQFDIYSLADVERPELLGSSVGRLRVTEGICASGNRAWVADGGYGMLVYDVSDPTQIRYLTTVSSLDWAYDVESFDSLLYLSDEWAGVRVINPYALGQPRGVGYLETPGTAIFTDFLDGVCYLADVTELTICRYRRPNDVEERSVTPGKFGMGPLYPNPANGFVIVNFSMPEPASGWIRLYDVSGREVLRDRFASGSRVRSALALEELPSGTYRVAVEIDGPGARRMKIGEEILTILK